MYKYTWGSSKPLKFLKFIARLKSSKVFKVKLLPETLLPDYGIHIGVNMVA